MHDLIFALPEN